MCAAAEKALSLDENNVECQWIMCELNLIYDELEQAELHHQKAFTLNPNDPRIVAQRGELLTWQGHPVEGADWLRQAMRLDPYDAAGRAHLLGRALYVARYYVDAIEAFKQVSVLRYGHLAEIAACYFRPPWPAESVPAWNLSIPCDSPGKRLIFAVMPGRCY